MKNTISSVSLLVCIGIFLLLPLVGAFGQDSLLQAGETLLVRILRALTGPTAKLIVVVVALVIAVFIFLSKRNVTKRLMSLGITALLILIVQFFIFRLL